MYNIIITLEDIMDNVTITENATKIAEYLKATDFEGDALCVLEATEEYFDDEEYQQIVLAFDVKKVGDMATVIDATGLLVSALAARGDRQGVLGVLEGLKDHMELSEYQGLINAIIFG